MSPFNINTLLKIKLAINKNIQIILKIQLGKALKKLILGKKLNKIQKGNCHK